MKKVKPSIGQYFKMPNPGLWAYFKHNVTGQPDDYRPPFFNRMDRSKVLQLWEDELKRLGMCERYPELYAYEQDMKSKVGPMSIQKPLSERIEDIEHYYTMIDNDSVAISDEAIDATVKFFERAKGLRKKSQINVLEDMRLSTNSGSWLFTKRRNVVDETRAAILDDRDPSTPKALLPNGGNYKLAAILGWRGQEGGSDVDDVKQRVVFMMPFLLNIHELQYYQPFVSAMQRNKLIPAYVSMDEVDKEVTALFDTKAKDDVVICTDFSKFDQHFNKDMQDAAWKILSRLFDKNAALTRELFDIKFNIPLICSDSLMYVGPHGMGSGSGGTNADECLAHKALQFESAIKDKATLNPHSMAYGDDGILTYPGITVDSVIQTYTSHGQEMNPTKQYVSKHDCVVLRRWHGMNYRVNGTMVGVYSTFRALGRLLAQERYYDPDKWSANMVTLRALSILENCKWHPYFHEFIDFVKKGDKYGLGTLIPGFFKSIEKLAKEAIESFPDFLGYTKSLQASDNQSTTGIRDWEVVKYLTKNAK